MVISFITVVVFQVSSVICIGSVSDIQGPYAIVCIVLKGAILCISENEALTSLSSKASDRLVLAFRPKTSKAYVTMFITFITFCIITKSCITNVKVNFILYGLPFEVLDHPKVKYFVKALKINMPLAINSYNVISIPILMQTSQSCEAFR